MPTLSEIGWIWEGVKLLLRFAPAAEKLVTNRLSAGVDSSQTEIQLFEQFQETQADLEAQLNDLRKQSQEQNLKLNQIQVEIHGLQQQLEVSLTHIREARNDLARLWFWVRVTAGSSLLTAVLLILLFILRR